MKQSSALALMQQGKNVFLTGAAGAGKTYVLNQYIDWLRRHGISPGVTASTGIAATHIGGKTIHSWSGMGIKDALDQYYLDELMTRERLFKQINNTNVLILDEISMVSPALLDAVDQITRAMRGVHDKAFGGIQVVLCGDFYQLPPIMRFDRSKLNSEDNQDAPSKVRRFAWQSAAWLDAQITPCYITEQHRQGDDPLLKILNDIRDGEVSEESQELLQSRFAKDISGEVLPTRLYTHNADVDSINFEQLEKLDSAAHYYEIKTKGAAKNVEQLLRGSLIQEDLELREGAQVMFIRNNYEKGYVNGSRGTVTGFTDGTDYPVVELFGGGSVIAAPEEWAMEVDGKKTASIEQIPLRLAWAITVHKSQGMSLDTAEIDLSRTFEMGQGYVALSRVRSLDGLYLKGFNTMATQIDPLTIRVDERFRVLSDEHESSLQELSAEQLQENIENFIEQCGGSVEEVDYEDEKTKALQSTYEKTLELLEAGKDLDEIAAARSLTVDTVIRHLLVLGQKGERLSLDHMEFGTDDVEAVGEAYDELINSGDDELFAADGQLKLKPIHTMLDGEIEYDDIKRALLKVQNDRI